MLTHLKKLSIQTLGYSLGDAATSLIGLLLLPVYTRLLTPADYGKLAIIALATTITTLLLESGQRSAFFRYYSQMGTEKERRRLTGTVFIYLLVSAATLLSPLLLFFDRIAAPFAQDLTMVPLFRIALLSTFFDVASVIPFATFRAEQRAVRYAALSAMRFFISAVLNILAVVVLRWGVVGVIYANLTTSVLFFSLCIGLLLGKIEWTVDRTFLTQTLRFGLPIVPAALAGWVLTFSDRFFLERFGNISQVGIYAVGYSVAASMNMMMGWVNNAWGPYCFSIAAQRDAKEVYAKTLTYAMTLFTLAGLGLSLFSREILSLLVAPSYSRAASIIPPVVLAYLFFEINYFIAFGLDLSGKTKYYPLIIITAAVLNLSLNLILIPPFGMMGAAMATLLSYSALPLIGYVVVHRLYPVPYEWQRLLKLAMVSGAVFWIGEILKTNQVALDLFMGAALIFVWAFALYEWRFFTRTELSTLRSGARGVLPLIKARLRQGVFGGNR